MDGDITSQPSPLPKELLELINQSGGVPYSPPPMRAIRGIAFTYEALIAFVDLVKSTEIHQHPVISSALTHPSDRLIAANSDCV